MGMTKQERIERVIIYLIFALYLLLLIKILFISRVSLNELFDSSRDVRRSFNLIPFQSINNYLSVGAEGFSIGNIFGNFILFMPLGVYLPLLKKDKRISTNMFYIFIATVLVEVLQWTLGIGAADIDDVILNFAGGFIGILGYKLFHWMFKGESGAQTAVFALSILGLPLILYLLFAINMAF